MAANGTSFQFPITRLLIRSKKNFVDNQKMRSHEHYRNREQTYVKHFFLEQYLERVAYNVYSFSDEFVFVDGFSGPWRSENEDFKDTSFVIATEKLKKIRADFLGRGRNVEIRCLFIEKSAAAYRDLENAVQSIDGIEIKTIHGEFENLVPEIVAFIDRSFSLVFIDPTGWSGYGLNRITPLLKLRGEVIINFMFDHINRFIEDPRPETAATFDPLFGNAGWLVDYQTLVNTGLSRENAVLTLYRRSLKEAGAIPYVTSTRVKKPLHERSYFHLIYTTRHWKGLVEFRNVERQAADEQEQVRNAARLAKCEEDTGTSDLFAAIEQKPNEISRPFSEERAGNLNDSKNLIRETLHGCLEIKYESLLGIVLEIPLVWKTDVNEYLAELARQGTIEIQGLGPRERTPKNGHLIRWTG